MILVFFRIDGDFLTVLKKLNQKAILDWITKKIKKIAFH